MKKIIIPLSTFNIKAQSILLSKEDCVCKGYIELIIYYNLNEDKLEKPFEDLYEKNPEQLKRYLTSIIINKCQNNLTHEETMEILPKCVDYINNDIKKLNELQNKFNKLGQEMDQKLEQLTKEFEELKND